MSSPDPLNDSTMAELASLPPSSATRRVTRSQRSQRFVSLGSSSDLHMLENNGQLQNAPSSASATSRKLFQSTPASTPSRRLRQQTTTTTVPLRESMEEDEDDADATTPKARGRQRKSNGTPMPSAGTKRRAGTPVKRTPRRPRTAATGSVQEPNAQPAPTPRRSRRPRETRDASTVETVSGPGSEATPRPSTARRGGRRRRQALAPEELVELADEVGDLQLDTTQLPPITSEDEVDLVRAPSESTDEESRIEQKPVKGMETRIQRTESGPQHESDIWMATMTDEATPKATTSNRDILIEPARSESLPSDPPVPIEELQEDPDVETSQGGDFGGYAYGGLGPAPSDVSSADDPDEPSASTAPAAYDTIAQGEDFSMIFMDSLPSLQFNNSVPAIAHDELGDETHQIINNTLESLRQEAGHGTSSGTLDRAEQELGSDEGVDLVEPSQAEADAEEQAADPLAVSKLTPTKLASPPTGRPSPRWSRTPRKQGGSSPLRHRVLKNSARQAEESAASQPSQDEDGRISPKPNQSPASIPQVEQGEEESNSYEDSFSEIPEAVLAAATPSRPQTSFSYDDLEDEVEQIQMGGSQDDDMFDDGQQLHYNQPEIYQEEALIAEENAQSLDDEPENMYQYQRYPQQVVEDTVWQVDHGGSEPVDDMLETVPDAAHQSIAQAERVSQNQNRGLDMEELPEHENEQGDRAEAIWHQVQLDAEADELLEEEIEERDEEQDQSSEEEQEEDGLEEEDDDDEPRDAEMYDEGRPVPSNASLGARSDTARLPTPDDTPPQVASLPTEGELKTGIPLRSSSRLRSVSKSPAKSTVFSMPFEYPQRQDQEVEEEYDDDPVEPEDMAEEEEGEMEAVEASPDEAILDAEPEKPAVTETFRKSTDATPRQQISSPMQEPQSAQQETLLDKASRPALSAIVRAGRVLQSITSDPPSPEGREKQLGSPFRSSGSKDSWSGSRDSQNSRRMSRSPLQPRGVAQGFAKSSSPANQNPSVSPGRPFGQVNLLDTFRRSQQEAALTRERSHSRHSSASSMRITPPSDGAMSWVAREGPISPRLRGDNTLQEASGSRPGSASLFEKQARLGPSDRPVQDTAREPTPEATEEAEEGEDGEGEPEERGDETDIWELEAQRQTPRSTRQQPFGKRVPSSNIRRSAIPSPWTKRSVQRPAASRMETHSVHDLSHLTEEPSRVAPAGPSQASEADEYSMLAQKQQEEVARPPTESAVKGKRFDFSSFFSSPTAIPGMLAQKFLPGTAQPPTEVRKDQPPSMEVVEQAPPVVPTSSMFPQMAQKELQPTKTGRSDLFSPARRRTRQPGTAGEQQLAGKDDQGAEQELEQSSPATPEKLGIPIVAQKQNFTPRPRQTSHTFFQPSSNRSTAVTPPRMQLSHADIHRWQQQTSNASEASSDFQRPLLRPLPPKNASPTKSSLRSPLKPHTPGPVVEFASSVLSPAEQVRVRQESRQNSSMLSQSGQQTPAPVAPVMEADDKENSDIHDISMEDAPPLTKPPQAESLSQTLWTRQHWLLLDELLQNRRQAPFDLNYEHRADKYLGKTVKSQGEAMKLERWHLDCVDAFNAEVGGWDEGVLAKRLFALILGEDRRAQSMIQRTTSTVMFH